MKTNYHELETIEDKFSFLVYHYGFKNKEDMVERVLNKQFHGTALENTVRGLLFTRVKMMILRVRI